MIRRVATVAALCLAAAPAVGAPVVAISDDGISNDPSPTTIVDRVNKIASTGARWTRVDVDWSYIAPTRPLNAEDPADPAYDWSRYDAIFGELDARGIGIMTVLYGTPPWASASGTWNAAPSAADGGAFAAAVARRYNGTWPKPGGGVLPRIRTISLRNEPNINLMTAPQCRRLANGRWVPVSPRNYVRLLQVGVPKVRAVNPKIIVVAGETASGVQKGGCKSASTTVGTLDFVALVKKELKGAKPPWDVWAQHVHPVGPPGKAAFFPSLKTMPQLTALLNTMRKRMRIMISETSYATTYTAYHRYFVTEAQQASYLAQTYALVARQPQIEMVVWFNLQDHRNWSAGLYREDWTEKPSLSRFQRLATTTPLSSKWALP